MTEDQATMLINAVMAVGQVSALIYNILLVIGMALGALLFLAAVRRWL